ncbi:MAG: peptide deformylase [Gammaproteobacteria bacterium]|nr:peptide deformylase [Gammaproteobacteria bacterium]
MALRRIELYGSEVLRRPADPVDDVDDKVRALVRDMFETMYDAKGIGLAAPQVGISRRVIVLDVEEESGESNRVALVNPRLTSRTKKKDKQTEGCLSIPGVEAVVQRPVSVVVDGTDPEGQGVRLEAEGLLARALQHEIDHLDGVLFVDRLSPLKRQLLLKKWRKLQAEAAEP